VLHTEIFPRPPDVESFSIISGLKLSHAVKYHAHTVAILFEQSALVERVIAFTNKPILLIM
jgi:hypothetical protein